MRYLCNVVLLCFAALSAQASNAQTNYSKIQIGTEINTGIETGMFVKPLPLPKGNWSVAGKNFEDIPIGSDRTALLHPLPFVNVTLVNSQPASSALYAMVISFTPDASKIIWGNAKCESKHANVLAESFGTSTSSVLYLCAYVIPLSGFKSQIASIPENDKWARNNLAPLSEHMENVPDDAILVHLLGNVLGGKRINYTFVLRRDGDLGRDSAYTELVKDWTMSIGQMLKKVLENNQATLDVPQNYSLKTTL